jgi:oligoendopeptidase F
MQTATRPTPGDFTNATWAEILPRFDALAEAPLDLTSLPGWLEEWSALDVALAEAGSLASIAYTTDTTNPEFEAAYERFAGEIEPQAQEQQVRLSKRLLEFDYAPDDLKVTIRNFRNQQEIFRAENVPLKGALQKLDAEYQRITGGMTAEWNGETLQLSQLKPFTQDPDRSVRERAYRLSFEPYIEQQAALSSIFDKQLELRQQIAANAGFANYRDYVFREKNRFDYTPADCETYHDAVAAKVVPALTRRHERRRKLLGVDSVRPWDLSADPLGRPGLKPYKAADELISGTVSMLNRVDPVFGGYLETMNREGLLDLESRSGKAPGGYCASLDYRERPFIFMNGAGTQDDVETLLHEAGHCIHAFEGYASQPLTFSRYPGEEMAEVGSMAMELLAAPYYDKAEGGFYSTDDAKRARTDHLESILEGIAWIATVDAFQHWIYTHPEGANAEARDAEWRRVKARFEPSIDWSGIDDLLVARWYRQLHIFLVPFYYIEYGLAQLGALQVWRNSLRDQQGATSAYRQALALGNTRTLPELYAAAGAKFSFDHQTIGELVEMVEEHLAVLDA